MNVGSTSGHYWVRAVRSTGTNNYQSSWYIELTFFNLSYNYEAPSAYKFIISPCFQEGATTGGITALVKKTAGSCKGIRYGRDSDNRWYVDLYLAKNVYAVYGTGTGFELITPIENVSMDDFAYVTTLMTNT